MQIHIPTGEVGTPAAEPAPALRVLSGSRIGILDNTKPNAGVLLSRLAAGLAERTGATVATTETKNAALAAPDDVLARLEKQVQVVLTGSAD